MEKAPIKKENNVQMPEGYKEVKCAACGAEYYVPEDCVPEDTAFICPECAQSQANAAADSKSAAEAALRG